MEGTPQGPPVCQQAGLPLQSNGYYNQPTQYGSIGFVFTPVKKFHAVAGYRMSDTDGQAPPINIRQVPGSLQSQYQTPYGTLAYDLTPNWTWKANYDYYSYGEGTPIGLLFYPAQLPWECLHSGGSLCFLVPMRGHLSPQTK